MNGDRLDRRDLSKWGKPVQDLLLHLVNAEGIRYRQPDAGHILLYPPDGESRFFKAAASRPDERQLHYLRTQFMAPHDIKGPDGLVPGTENGTGEDDSMSVEQVAAETPEALVRALAASLGVEIEGGCSEEDYLAVVAENEAHKQHAEAQQLRLSLAHEDIDARDHTISELTMQRDALLKMVADVRKAIDQ